MGLLPKAIALAALLCFTGFVPTIPAYAATERVTAAEAALLQQALDRGRLIYAYDQAAWHGTDDLVAKLPDYQSRVGGWIVDGPAEAPELVFFDKAGTRPVYVARFRDGELVSSQVFGADAGELSASRRKLIAAREAALAALGKSKVKRCSKAAMNSVVLPPAAPGEPTLVYFLEPQRVMDAIPFGGHYLFPVDPSGRVGAMRRFTKTCIEISRVSVGNEGEELVSLLITHLLDRVPTEIHVFSSLAARLPVWVGTRDGRIWQVDGTAIRLIPKKQR
jgi:hypothetical protein